MSGVHGSRNTEPQYSELPTAEEELGFRIAGFPKTPLQFYQQEACRPKVIIQCNISFKLYVSRLSRSHGSTSTEGGLCE